MFLFLASLVFACATLSNAGCRFEKSAGKALNGHNTEVLTFTKPPECAEACRQSTKFSCLSFDYNFVNIMCFMSAENRHTYPEAYKNHSSSDYYEKVCGDDIEDEDLMAPIVTTPAQSGACGSWREFGGSCYKVVFEDDKNWNMAQNDCISYGGYLASLNTEQEYSFVTSWLDAELEERGERLSYLELFWIGGRKHRRPKRWMWEEGSSAVPMNFSKWHYGEPNYGFREKVVSLVRKNAHFWGFNDNNMDNRLRYVCEMKLESDSEGSDGSSENRPDDEDSVEVDEISIDALGGDGDEASVTDSGEASVNDSDEASGDDNDEASGDDSDEASGGDGDVCVEHTSIVPEIKALNRKPGAWLNVLTSHRIMRAGRLTRWKYFAARAGVVYLDIWRRGNDGQLVLVGYNRVVCKGPGYWEYSVPVEQQIRVQVFDMVGVHYPKSAEASDQGVVYYEDSRNPGSFVDSSKWLSSVVNAGLFDDTLREGSAIPDEDLDWMNVKRTMALGADIDCGF